VNISLYTPFHHDDMALWNEKFDNDGNSNNNNNNSKNNARLDNSVK
jgi:hypothetical protein